jgi:hypothetical protein
MEQGDEGALSAASVPAQKPYLPLDFIPADGENIAMALKKRAAVWREAGVKWNRIEQDKASGSIVHESDIGAPHPVMTGVCFVQVQGVWKFAGWK